MKNIETEYKEWQKVWELSTPKPKKTFDWLFRIQVLPAVGAIVLSGTRTGNVVAELGSFASFGEKINYLGLSPEVFIGAEAVLTFITFELIIFLSGAFLTLKTKKDFEVGSWLLLPICLIPVLLANIYPGLFPLLAHLDNTNNSNLVLYSQVLMNSIVGLSTSLIVLALGYTIKVSYLQTSQEYKEELETWEKAKKAAWVRSSEYRTYKQTVEPQKNKVSASSTGAEDTLLKAINNGHNGRKIEEIALSLNMTSSEVFGLVETLEAKKLIERKGVSVYAID